MQSWTKTIDKYLCLKNGQNCYKTWRKFKERSLNSIYQVPVISANKTSRFTWKLKLFSSLVHSHPPFPQFRCWKSACGKSRGINNNVFGIFLSSLFLSKIAHEINLRILSPNNCSSSGELVSQNSNMTIHHKHSFHGRLKRTLRHATTEIFNARNISYNIYS